MVCHPSTAILCTDGGRDVCADTAQRKQLLLRAMVQLLALFVVCLVGLGGTLWLALPVIAPEDKPNFKLPRNFDDLKNLNTVLQHYKSEHFAQVLLCWVVVYMSCRPFRSRAACTCRSSPARCSVSHRAVPSSLRFRRHGSHHLLPHQQVPRLVLVALPSWQKRVDEWKDKLAEHEDNMLSYLIILRMIAPAAA